MSIKAVATQRAPFHRNDHLSPGREGKHLSTTPRRAPSPKRPNQMLPTQKNRGPPHYHKKQGSAQSVGVEEALKRGGGRSYSLSRKETQNNVGYLSPVSLEERVDAVSMGRRRGDGPSESWSGRDSCSSSNGRLSNRSRSRGDSTGGVDRQGPVLHEVEPPSYVVGNAVLNPFISIAPSVQPLVQIVATSLQVPSAAMRPLQGGAARLSDDKVWSVWKGTKECWASSGKMQERNSSCYQIEMLFPPNQFSPVSGWVFGGGHAQWGTTGILSDMDVHDDKEEKPYVKYSPSFWLENTGESKRMAAVLSGLEGVMYTPGGNVLCVEEVCNVLDSARPTVAKEEETTAVEAKTPRERSACSPSTTNGVVSDALPESYSLPLSSCPSVLKLQQLYSITTNDVPAIFQGANASRPPLTAARVLPVLLHAEERVAELAAKRRLVDWDITIPTAETIPPPAIAFLDGDRRPVSGLSLLVFVLDSLTLRLIREDKLSSPSGKEGENDSKVSRSGRLTPRTSSPPSNSVGDGNTTHCLQQKSNSSTVGNRISYEGGVHRIHGLVGILSGLAEKVGLDRVMEYEVETAANELFVSPPYLDSEVGDLVLQLNETIQGTVKLVVWGYDCGSVDTSQGVVQKSVNALECVVKVQYSHDMGTRPTPPVETENGRGFQRSRKGKDSHNLGDRMDDVNSTAAKINHHDTCGSSFVFSATNPHELRYEECRQATREYIALKTSTLPTTSRPVPQTTAVVLDGSASGRMMTKGSSAVRLVEDELAEETKKKEHPFGGSLSSAELITRSCDGDNSSFSPEMSAKSAVLSSIPNSSLARSAQGLATSSCADLSIAKVVLECLEDPFGVGNKGVKNYPLSTVGVQGPTNGTPFNASPPSGRATFKTSQKDASGEERLVLSQQGGDQSSYAGMLGDQLTPLERLPDNIGPCEPMSTSIAFQLSHTGQLLLYFYLPKWQFCLSSFLYLSPSSSDEEIQGDSEREHDTLFSSVPPEARATTALFMGPDSEIKRDAFVKYAREKLKLILDNVVYSEVPIDVSAKMGNSKHCLATSEETMVLLRDFVIVLALERDRTRCFRYHELVTLCHRLYHSALMKTCLLTRGKDVELEQLAEWAITPEEDRPAACWRSPLFNSGKMSLSASELQHLRKFESILRVAMSVSFHIGAFKEGIFYATQRIYTLCLLHDGATREVCQAQKELAEQYAIFGDYFTAQQLALDVVALSEKLYDITSPQLLEAQILSTICNLCANEVETGIMQLNELYEYCLEESPHLSPRHTCLILLLVVHCQSTCSLFRQDYPKLVLEDPVALIAEVIQTAGGEDCAKPSEIPLPSKKSFLQDDKKPQLSKSKPRFTTSTPKMGKKNTSGSHLENKAKEHVHPTHWSSNNSHPSVGSAAGIAAAPKYGSDSRPLQVRAKIEVQSAFEKPSHEDTHTEEGKNTVVTIETEDGSSSVSEHLRVLILAVCGNLLIRCGSHSRGILLLSKVFKYFFEYASPSLLPRTTSAEDGTQGPSVQSSTILSNPQEDKQNTMNISGRRASVSSEALFPTLSVIPHPPKEQLEASARKMDGKKTSADFGAFSSTFTGGSMASTDWEKNSENERTEVVNPTIETSARGKNARNKPALHQGVSKVSSVSNLEEAAQSSVQLVNEQAEDLISTPEDSPASSAMGTMQAKPLKSTPLSREQAIQEFPKDPFGFCTRLLWWIASEWALWRMWSVPSSWGESVEVLRQSVKGMEACWGPNHPFSAVTSLLLSQSLQNCPHSNALRMAQRSMAVFHRGVSPRSKYFLLVHRTLSRLHTLEHLWKEALEHSNAALILGQINFSTDDLMCQMEEDFLGCLLRCPPGTVVRLDQNLLLQRLQDRITHLQSIYGLHSELLIWPLVNLADAYYISRDLGSAVTCLQRAVRLADPKGALFVTSATLKPSALLPNKDEVERRNLILSTVLQTRDRILQLSQVLFTLAGVLEATGTISDAQDCYCRCLGLLEAAGVERSLSAIRVYIAVSKLLYSSKEYGDSLGWARKAERFTHSHYPEWVYECRLTKSLLAIVEQRLHNEEGTYVTVNPHNYYFEEFVELI